MKPKRNLALLFFLIVIILSFVLIKEALRITEQRNRIMTEFNQTQMEQQKNSNKHSIGNKVELPPLSLWVNNTYSIQQIDTYDGMKKPNLDSFLVVDVVAKNNGDKNYVIVSDNFKVIEGGNRYKPDSTAMIYINKDITTFFLTEIEPNETVNGLLVFDILEESVTAEDLRLEIISNMILGEKTYIYLN